MSNAILKDPCSKQADSLYVCVFVCVCISMCVSAHSCMHSYALFAWSVRIYQQIPFN